MLLKGHFWKFFSQLIIITNLRYYRAQLTPKRPTGGCFAWATGCRPGKLNGAGGDVGRFRVVVLQNGSIQSLRKLDMKYAMGEAQMFVK